MDSLYTLVSKIAVNDLVAVGSLGVAFLALFVAPIVNARISRRQVIAPMRQVWINTLRDRISEFISLVSIGRLHICPSNEEEDAAKREAHREDRSRYERLKLIAAGVELHINPKEKDHRELVDRINEIVEAYHDNHDTRDQVKALVKLSQKILKEEWEVTKKT